MSGQLVYSGVRLDVECLVLPDGTCPSGTFLSSLVRVDRIRMQVVFAALANKGKIWNPEHYLELDEPTCLVEVRSLDVWFLGFHHDRTFYLLLGARSRRRKHLARDIRLAERYRAEFLLQTRSRDD